VTLTVESDSSYTVQDNLPPLVQTDGRPKPGRDGSLIELRRWRLAAAVAVSARATVEVHASGRVWRQELSGAGSPSAISGKGPSSAIGTRATFSLDQAYFAAGSSLPADAEGLARDIAAELGSDFGSRPLPGTLTIVDLRSR
jgi:hypothetical protein